MDNSRNISRNTLGDNATLNQGNITHITFNSCKDSYKLPIAYHQLISGMASSDNNREFFRNIGITDPVYDKIRVQTLKGPLLHESFRWVLDHEEFNKWRKGDSGVFWVKGDPGKGKTMLLCGIIDEFEKDPSLSSNLGYFFCQATDSRINTAIAVIGGLICPLLRRNQILLSQIRATYEGRFEGPNAWFVLCEIFDIVIQDPGFEDLIFIVDALDECIDGCSSLLCLIFKTSNKVRWLLSSRNEKEIEREFRPVKSSQILSLERNVECVSNSINTYIGSRIQDITALEDDEELRNKTLRTLTEKPRGTFLWVALVVEQLRSADHWQVEGVLAEIPAGLESLYGLIINQANNRLKERGRDACQILLSIITTAERPLHLKELYTFMSFQWEHFKSTYSLYDIQSIAKDCGSILSIKDDIVYFIHQSAKDFIIKEKFLSGLRDQHLKMFQTSTDAMCRGLKYDIYNIGISGVHITEIEPRDPDPLDPIKYCCVFWGQHLLEGYHRGLEDKRNLETNTILYTFLKKAFLCWLESLALMGCIPQALVTLKKLKYLIESHCRSGDNEDHNSQVTRQDRETQKLRQFINDAYEFLLVVKETVENWPLQLYFSATSFEQASSAIRQTFEQAVRACWGPSPIVTSGSRSRSSILLETCILKFPIEEKKRLSRARALWFSPDSSLMYSLHSNLLTVNRFDTGELEASMHIGISLYVAVDPDTKHVICANIYEVEEWSMKGKCCIQKYSYDLQSEQLINYIVALSPKGDLMASFHANLSCDSNEDLYDGMSKVRVWQTRTAVTVCDCAWVRAGRPLVTFSPNSEVIALTDQTGIKIHCSSTGNLIKCIDFHHHSKLGGARKTPVVISPDSKFLGICERDGVELWSIETGECISKIADGLHSMQFLPDWTESSLVALPSTPAAIQIRHVDINYNKLNTDGPDCAITSVLISPDSRFVAATHARNNGISIWSGDTGRQVSVLRWDFGHDHGCLLHFSPDSQLLALGGDNILIWRVTTGKAVCLLRHPDGKSPIEAWKVAIAVDSNYLVASGKHLYIWRIDTCKYVYKTKIFDNNHESLVSVAISPDLTHVATLYGGRRRWRMEILQWRTGRSVTKANISAGTNDKIVFSSDPAIFVYISLREVRFFEVATGTCLQQLDLQPSRLPTIFDPVKDLVFTSYSVICKIAWNHWEEFPRACYSYIHGEAYDDDDKLKASWIVRNGKRICYLPMDFRPNIGRDCAQFLDITDSLFAFINESGGLVIIKFPNQAGSQE